MTDQKQGMFVPALVGGVLAGVLSAVPFINCLCCLWIIGGAILAAFLLSKNSPVALTAGDGAIVGVFTGIIAAVTEAIVSLPFRAMNEEFVRTMVERFSEYSGEIPSGWDRFLEPGAVEPSLAWSIIGLVISVFIFSALGALGGIIGVSLFGKKKPQGHQGDPYGPKNTGDRQP